MKTFTRFCTAVFLLSGGFLATSGCQGTTAKPAEEPKAEAKATVPPEMISDEDAASVAGGKVGSNGGLDPCGLRIHTCDYHYNGKVYTEAFSAYGKHAYNANPACQFIPGGPGGFTPTWTITAGYRVFPYSTDMIVSGTCPNCTIRICCGGESNHWAAVETDP